MGILGGVLKSVINPMSLAQLAMGPAGWASIAAKAIMSSIAQQVIQKVGDQLGLPQGAINLAQQAFSSASGGGAGGLGSVLGRGGSIADTVSQLAKLGNLSPSEEGKLTRQAEDIADSFTKEIMRDMGDKAKKMGKKAEEKEAGKGGGFLRAIAEALGAAADQKMNEMYDLSNKIKAQTDSNGSFIDSLGDKPSQKETMQAQQNQTKLGTYNSMYSAVSQELSILQNVISTALKTVGEAQSTVARKN